MGELIDTDYLPYDKPKLARFKITGDKYLEGGWEKILEIYKIIGETKLWYVHEIREDKTDKTLFCVGIHKTRLERWMDTQLELFQ